MKRPPGRGPSRSPSIYRRRTSLPAISTRPSWTHSLPQGLPPQRLELEITESLLIDDYERPRTTLLRLRDHGISIALDDFGTGYSSLTYLRQFPFDRIKIDQIFVAEMTTRADCAAIVVAVVGLGRSLGINITAEGIETRDQLLMLQAAGCTEGQGYLICRPKPGAEIAETLTTIDAVRSMAS